MIYGGAYRALQHLRALKARAVHFVGHLARAVQTKIADAASWGYHAATTAWDTGVSAGSRVVHAVTRWAAPYYQKTIHVLSTAFHGGGPPAQQARLSHRNGNLMGHLGIEPTGPTAGLYRDMTRNYAGGWRSFLGGMGQPLASMLDLASCAGDALQCARDQATGSTYSALYLHWLHGQGVLTGASSWFGAGAGTTDFITAMLGSMAGGPETAATSITDLAPEEASRAIAASTRVYPWAGPTLSRVTQEGETMYRVWGGQSAQAGEWLTPMEPTSSTVSRAGLALPPENAATYVSRVTLPTGIRVQVGVAGEAFGQPGGWLQAQLLERIPLEYFGKGELLGP